MFPTAVEVLERLGGVATRTTLVSHLGRAGFERALKVGDVVRLDRTRYGHPQLDWARQIATRVGGVVAACDAAQLHGWEIARPARRPHLCVPRGRRIPAGIHAEIHRVDLSPWERDGLSTAPETTLVQSARWLPFDEALAITDSALRHGMPTSTLERLAAAANPFESVLRATCLSVPGLAVEPQVWVSPTARPDLVDRRLRIVIEADSFTWHGSRSGLVRDARRYNQLVVDGWLVLRFTYEDAMHRPDEVRRVLEQAVAAARASTQVRSRGRNRPDPRT